MTINSWTKEKKTFSGLKKKRVNWHQSLKSNSEKITKDKDSKFKKSLQFILLLKKFDNIIDFKNIRLLKAFLTKYGKIRPRRKTRVSPQQQRAISKSIKKARALGLIPFTCDVKI
jgi:small subunit ribosomal protein S18